MTSQAEPYFRAGARKYLFRSADIPQLVTKSLPATLEYVLEHADDVDWPSVSDVGGGGLTAFHYSQVQPSFERLMAHLHKWAEQVLLPLACLMSLQPSTDTCTSCTERKRCSHRRR